MRENRNLINIAILILLAYFFFLFGNGIVSLSIPDEVFYAQTAKEMSQNNSWMTPIMFGQPQFEKPIFLYWLLRAGFIIFGMTSFAARFFPAIFAMIGVIAVYLLCLMGFKDQKKAFLSSIILMSSGLYIGLARTVFTDMIFSIFILLSLVSFFWAYTRPARKTPGILLFYIFCALAVLSKGPLGFAICVFTVLAFLAIKKDLKFIFSKCSLWGLPLFILISFPWYILMIVKYGNTFTYEFFYNDHIRRIFEAEHRMSDTWHFYPLTMIWGMMPWGAFVAVSLFYFFKNLKRSINPIYLFLACWIIVTFIIFQPAHSKLASYIFPLFPALAIIAGDFIYDASVFNKKRQALFHVSLVTLISLILIIIVFIAGLVFYSAQISAYAGNTIPVAILLALVSIIAIFYLIYMVKGKFLKSAYALMFLIPAIFSIVPLIDSYIEPYVSTRESCEYLLSNYKIENKILCSKFFVRGVKYYSDKDVAVMDIPGKQFFSPHPILFLNSDAKVAELLRQQKTTYCILKKNALDDIDRLSGDFEIKMLNTIGNEFIVKIEVKKGAE